MISIVKGCGTIALTELEKCLEMRTTKFDVKERIIHMAFVEDMDFYEINDYCECKTSPRFRGTGNIHCTKIIGIILSITQNLSYNLDHPYMYQFIAGFIVMDRKHRVCECLTVTKRSIYSNHQLNFFSKKF